MGAAPEVTGRATASARAGLGRRLIEIAVGALLVAAAAQAAVPVPFSPVPMTLQPLAVLVVGGLLGASGGVAALVTYLALGVAGLPVFAGGSAGVWHLAGPTGGYLLAFPVAAGVTGALVGRSAGIFGCCWPVRSAWWSSTWAGWPSSPCSGAILASRSGSGSSRFSPAIC
jgi:Uncharacterized conserved protein